jgi:hypothetical protein
MIYYQYQQSGLDRLWKQPKNTYRGDTYNTGNPSSDIVNSTPGNKVHDTHAHYNILFGDGTKAAILIKNQEYQLLWKHYGVI